MEDKFEKLIQAVYKKWKSAEASLVLTHPSDEDYVCFLEGRLSAKESERIGEHVLLCDSCAEALAIQIKIKDSPEIEVPDDVLERSKKIVAEYLGINILEAILKFAGKAIEIINTSGDVLVGQELIPAPVLRSRSIKEFHDELTILKDFADTRIEIKVQNRGGDVFDVTVVAKDKKTQNPIKDIRITLISNDLELESYLSETGKVLFEHIILGKYTIEIASLEDKLATVILDIKK